MGKASTRTGKTKGRGRGETGLRTSDTRGDQSADTANTTGSLSRLFDAVRIQEVSLVDCRALLRIRPQGTLRLGVSRTASATRAPDGKVLCAQVRFTLEGRTENDSPDEPILVIEATFRASYEIPADLQLNESSIELFALTNETFNLWPYWREFVQSMSSRMGIPALTVPTYRIEQAFSGPGTANRASASNGDPEGDDR